MVKLAIKKSVARQILWVLRKGGNNWETQPRGQPGNAGRFASAGNTMVNGDSEVMTEKQPWDSSDEKARELKLSDFGTPEEVREMAQMPRVAKNRDEAVALLREIAKRGKLISKYGVVASLSGKSIDKIVSKQALHHSFDIQAHWQATANIDKLFSNAIEKWIFELNPNKTNENLKDRKYLYAPMEYSGRIIPVKFTVKEYQQVGLEKRLYSLEAINVELE